MPVLTRTLASLWSAVVVVYLFGVIAAAPYYNWQYAKAHGFLSWVAFGQIVPTVKAMAWPLYGLNLEGSSVAHSDAAWSDEEKENAAHFIASMAASQRAVRLSNDGDSYSIIDAATVRELAELNRAALREARLVTDAVLEKALPIERPGRWLSASQSSVQDRLRLGTPP